MKNELSLKGDSEQLYIATTKNKKQINYGINLLRFLAMFFVITLHLLQSTKVIPNFPKDSPQFIVGILLRSVVICAVNVYALISGFVGINSKFKLSKVVSMWLQVFVIAMLGYLCALLVKVETFSIINFLEYFAPVLTKKSWFFNAYFFLMFLMPFYNILINKISKKQYFVLICMLIFFSAVIGLISRYEIWGLNNGFSTLWLSVLYFIGAYFKKYGFPKIPKLGSLIIFLGSTVVIFVYYIITYDSELFSVIRIFNNYNVIFIVMQAISLLHLFSQITIKSKTVKKIATFATPLVFGIYLWHQTSFSVNFVFKNLGELCVSYHWATLLPLIISFAIVVFIVCAILEYTRQLIFKILYIEKFSMKCSNFIQNKISQKLEKSFNKQN